MLLVSISLVMPQVSKEFSPQYATLLSAAQYAGLFVGALLFGLIGDLLGRRLAWQLSIFGVSAFTMVCASSPNWAALNVFVAICGLFGGGNCVIHHPLCPLLLMRYQWPLTSRCLQKACLGSGRSFFLVSLVFGGLAVPLRDWSVSRALS